MPSTLQPAPIPSFRSARRRRKTNSSPPSRGSRCWCRSGSGSRTRWTGGCRTRRPPSRPSTAARRRCCWRCATSREYHAASGHLPGARRRRARHPVPAGDDQRRAHDVVRHGQRGRPGRLLEARPGVDHRLRRPAQRHDHAARAHADAGDARPGAEPHRRPRARPGAARRGRGERQPARRQRAVPAGRGEAGRGGGAERPDDAGRRQHPGDADGPGAGPGLRGGDGELRPAGRPPGALVDRARRSESGVRSTIARKPLSLDGPAGRSAAAGRHRAPEPEYAASSARTGASTSVLRDLGHRLPQPRLRPGPAPPGADHGQRPGQQREQHPGQQAADQQHRRQRHAARPAAAPARAAAAP